MPINYSLGLKTAAPGKKSPQKKIYASAQYTQRVKTETMARDVAKHSFAGNRGMVGAVISAVVDYMREQLLDGKRVDLGDLGTFYCAINCHGADSVESFTPARNIEGLTVKWRPGKQFRDLGKQARYKLVGKRTSQRQQKRQSKQMMREALGTTAESSAEEEA